MRRIKIFGALIIVGVILASVISVLPRVFEDKRPAQGLVQRLEAEGAVDFASSDIYGAPFKFSDYKGKVIILSFWASWCAPCVEEMPSMIKLIEQYGDKIQLVAVSADYNMDELNRFLKALKISKMNGLTVAWDEHNKIGETYEVGRLPETYIFDSNFKLVKKVVGAADWAGPDAISFFTSLMKPN